MSDVKKVNKGRRNLVIASCAAGGAAGVAAAVPFAASWLPSERAKAGGAPVVADISTLKPGEMMTVEWRSKPVWIIRRTKEMLEGLARADAKVSDPKSDVPMQPEYAKNEYRSIKPELLVLVGICTHLGCSPQEKPAADKAEMGADWAGGFLCPCHGSKFDLAGRVYKGAPAPVNLEVPKYTYLSDTRILIGDDTKGA
ncbi:MAG: ubiquinol-cytochrome c reductase iron-sulfur subunit [Burkholderiales bacterium]|nr:ubiquinol-cytochrome c reductase iron-sulfur subunit [Burkholderiales bacterium]